MCFIFDPSKSKDKDDNRRNKMCTYKKYVILTIFLETYFSIVCNVFFSFGATAPVLALAYLHETLRFTSVY
jgi:hypothetical protein